MLLQTRAVKLLELNTVLSSVQMMVVPQVLDPEMLSQRLHLGSEAYGVKMPMKRDRCG